MAQKFFPREDKLKTNIEWRLLACRDPLYGVVTWPDRGKEGKRTWIDIDFYALGEEWLDFAK